MDWKKVGKNTFKYTSPTGFAIAKSQERKSDPEYQASREEKKQAKDAAREEKKQAKEAKRQAVLAARPDHIIGVGGLTDGSITIKDGRIYGPSTSHGNVALAGATAVVETAGDIDRRVTATRLIMTGPLAFGLRKKKDNRELFLTVEGSDGVFVVKVSPDKQQQARNAAAKITTLGKQAAARARTVKDAATGPAAVASESKVAVELTPEQADTTAAPESLPSVTPVVSVADELTKLAALVQSGFLTQEQYESQKEKLLGAGSPD
jgi:hypothetical protein